LWERQSSLSLGSLVPARAVSLTPIVNDTIVQWDVLLEPDIVPLGPSESDMRNRVIASWWHDSTSHRYAQGDNRERHWSPHQRRDA
jgi:hypothetical protein